MKKTTKNSVKKAFKPDPGALSPSAPPEGEAFQDVGGEEIRTAIKKKPFLDEAIKRSGVEKKYAKPAIEAALALLSEALIDGKKVNLPPLGKIKVNRVKDLSDAKVLKLSLRIPDHMGVATPDALVESSIEANAPPKTSN
jgi:hypothetical protein